MKPATVDTTVVQKMTKLHRGEIPRHLLQKDAVRTGKDFDPNAYFTVLTHLAMKPGYTLDYVYLYMDGFGGNPCLYARPADEKPLGSFIEHRDWEEKNSVHSFLVADGSPDSFFQPAVFRRLAGQFYLYWHANYNDLRILTTLAEMEALISEVNEKDFSAKFTDGQIADLKRVEPQPTVEVFDDRASATYCVFTKWGGLARLKESFRRLPPHLLVGQELLDEMKYDCHVCY